MRRSVGSVLVIAAAALAAGEASAADRWIKATSPNFVIYTDVNEAGARRLADQLEAFDQLLRLRHGVPVTEPVRRKLPIYLLRRKGDLRRISPGISANVEGFYTSSSDDTYAVAVEGDGSRNLLHEYVHHFMLRRFPAGYPGWLVEGYPEFFSTFRRTPEYIEIGKADENRVYWLANQRWLPYRKVLASTPSTIRSSEDQAMFYAQAWGLTHWFLSDPQRSKQLNAYIDAVGEGADPVAALQTATGLTPEQLDTAVRIYLTRGFSYHRLKLTLAPAPVTVETLPASAGDVLLPTLRVKNDNGVDAPDDRTDGPVLLEAVRKAAGPHAGDRLADLALARVEVKLGDAARAETLLKARIAADAKDVEALQLMAALKLKAAKGATPEAARTLVREAQRWAGQAHKLDPDYYPTLIVYAQAREGGAGYPNENDLNVLVDALDLAPQVGTLRLKAAQALVARRRTAEAAKMLAPLAFNAHGGTTAAEARAVLEGLQASAGATATQASAGGAR